MKQDSCSDVILDEDENQHFLLERHLDKYDQWVIEACRRLADQNSKFKSSFWIPYWSVHRSVFGQLKNKGFVPVVTNAPNWKNRSPKRKKRH